MKCFGVMYSDPSGWRRRESAVSEIHSLTSVGMMVLPIARGQMPVLKCQNGHGYSNGQLSLTVIIIRPCHMACRNLFPWPGIEPVPSAMETWSLNHWTAREFPWVIIKIASSVFMCVCVHAQSCLTLYDPLDCSPPGSSVHGIFQARMLELVGPLSSGDLSHPGKVASLTCVLASWFFTTSATWEALIMPQCQILVELNLKSSKLCT